MDSERLDSLAMIHIHIHRDIPVDISKVKTLFVKLHAKDLERNSIILPRDDD